MIQLYNTASRKAENFRPQNDKSVTMYTCGPTVYSQPHIGNWVANIRWDILVRMLIGHGYSVKRVMNITDVGHLVSDADDGEDKMTKGARKEGITEWEIAAKYTAIFLDEFTRLNLIKPQVIAKATETIDLQIALIKTLEERGYTYTISEGVYFDTATFPDYASFAQLDLDAQKAGARVEFNSEKRNSSDFVLWRLTPSGESRTMEWDSPWGRGIPGWHIECSAIALHHLANTIDIHAGGIDHIPVHHTNEIAQSEAATGEPFARYWIHANFLKSEGTKISKSLNNGYTLDDITSRGYPLSAFKMLVLQSHYRTEANFTWEALDAAYNRLRHWYAIAELRWQIHDTLVDDDIKDTTHDSNGTLLSAPHAALEALSNDLNTPEVLIIFEHAFDMVETVNSTHVQRSSLLALLESVDSLLGLTLLEDTPDITDAQKMLIVQRQRAREQKDWQTSDAIRNQLEAEHIYVRDTGTRSLWSRQPN